MIQMSTGSFWSKNVILDCKILFKLGRAEEKRNSSLLLCTRMHKSAAFKSPQQIQSTSQLSVTSLGTDFNRSKVSEWFKRT